MRAVDVVWRETGEGAPAIVQGPGWGPTSDYLRVTLAPLLAEIGLRVMTFDPRNVGDSPDVDAPDAQAASALAADLERLRRRLDLDRFLLFGHSHGAFVAMAYAVLHPERLCGLVLLDASLRGPSAATDDEALEGELREHQRQALDDQDEACRRRREIDSDRELARWMRRAMPANFHDPQAAEHFQRALVGARAPSARALRRVPEREAEGWVEERLPEVDLPTLVLTGSHDVSTPPADSRHIASLLPDARLAVIEGAGHHPWFERPEEFGAAIEAFLQELQPR